MKDFIFAVALLFVGATILAAMVLGIGRNSMSYTLTKPDGSTLVVEQASIFQGSVRWTELDGSRHSANSAGYTVTETKKKEK